jgi:two-component sensor histidine kinase
LAIGCVVGFATFGDAVIRAGERKDADKHKSILLRELAHGVANNFAAIAALIHTARESISAHDSRAKSVLDDAIEQVKIMARVHRRLRANGQDVSLDSKVFIRELCDDLEASIARGRPISIDCIADSHPLCMDHGVSLGLVINELVTNAIKHAFPDQRVGHIRVTFAVHKEELRLSVADDGAGFAGRHTAGLGLDLVRGLSRQLGGELREQSSTAGSAFHLSVPHLGDPGGRRPTSSVPQ